MADPDEANLAYQNLTPEQILDCIESIGYMPDGRLLALNSYENRVYQVGIEDDEPVVAKFYRPGRWTDAAIHEEHSFAIELERAQIPVVAPIASNDATLHTSGAFRFAVYPRKGGRWPELDDDEFLTQIGRFVARIHNVGATAEFHARPALDTASYGDASVDTVIDDGDLPGELITPYETLADDLLEAIDDAFAAAAPTAVLRIHADLHPGNLLARDAELHIVDLDDVRTGPAVQDLWMLLSGERAERERQLEKLLDGYTEFRDFDARELRLIEPLRTLRIIHYAAWLTRRYEDPAFQRAFPWFREPRYWEEHILSLREQLAEIAEPPLRWQR